MNFSSQSHYVRFNRVSSKDKKKVGELCHEIIKHNLLLNSIESSSSSVPSFKEKVQYYMRYGIDDLFNEDSYPL